tara:strand:- start:195 stop:695 length:501 start_codon:yes stop_codon:yes gene_type:complete
MALLNTTPTARDGEVRSFQKLAQKIIDGLALDKTSVLPFPNDTNDIDGNDTIPSTVVKLSAALDAGFSGGITPVTTTVIATTATLSANNQTVIADDDTAAGVVTLTLPAVATSAGLTYSVKKVGSTANVVIDGAGAETIDGATTLTLSTQYDSTTLYCDGTEWFII